MPSVADFIESNRAQLVQRYAEEVGKLESARGLSSYELIDTFPEYLSTLATISRQGHRGDPAKTKRRLEETHLSLRLRLGYNQEEVVSEYAAMGRLITGLWAGLPHEQQPAPEDTALFFAELQDAMDSAIAIFSGYSLEDRQREKRSLRRLDALDPKSLERTGESALQRQQLLPLIESIQEALSMGGAELYLVDEQGAHLIQVAATGKCSGSAFGVPIPIVPTSFLGQVAVSEEPVHLPDASTASKQTTAGLSESGLRSLLGLRLWPHGALLGVLYVGVAEMRSFEPQARRYLETLVEYLSGILDRALLVGELRKTNAQLRQSEVHWRLFVHNIQDYATIYMVDPEGRVISWNPGAERFEGYRAEEVLGKKIVIFYPEDLRERGEPEAHLREAAERGHFTVEGWRVRNKAPSPFWAEMTLIANRDTSGQLRGFTKITRDLSERQLAEQERTRLIERERQRAEQLQGLAEATTQLNTALRESDDRLRLALTAAQLGIWDLNPATGELRWDERCKALFGLPPDAQVTYDTFLARLHPEDRASTEAAVRHALSTQGGELNIAYRTVGLQDRQVRWVRALGRSFFEGGRAVRFIGTVQDISALRQAQEALARSEREFRTLAESMPQIVWTARPDGPVDYVNQRLEEFTGKSSGELLASGWNDILHPDNLPAVRAAWSRSVQTGEPYQVEQHIRRRDGVYRWHLTRAEPARDEQGRVIKWLGTSTDIDDMKRTEAELRQRATFEQQLIGIVSHDLRNPLNAITLSAQALLRGEELTERQAKSVARLVSASERATRMTRDLLDFTQARLGGGLHIERKPVDFHQTVRQVLEEVRAAHPERVIESHCGGDGRGAWDGDRLAQVVTNLVNNALAYSPAGTPVRVETRGEGPEVLLRVHNQGAPIAPDMLPQLFQPMRRGTEQGSAGRSIGLGLFIVDRIVHAHGGRIEVSSAEGTGTTFTVHLPRA